ncbi:MAG TPA: VOC family protein [Candidatus Dormibacteraeota bacterium]|nr:VOC family protein [Candidatus Dormibacteraeota bacterium]
MNPRIDVITIAVDNLERSLAFYRDGLGLKTEGIIATEFGGDETNAASAVVFFELEGGLKLALYPRSELAKDAGIAALPAGSSGFSIGHLVADKSKVDELLERARAAGAPISGGPRDRPWGIYSGYFRDPDGHLWEIIWNNKADREG